jgi:hypothetical protein
MVEIIKCNEKIIAIIVRSSFSSTANIHFFTPHEFSQQLAYMAHPSGKVIQPHIHNLIAREVLYTQEVLVIKKGKLRVDLYDSNKLYIESKILEAGDVILLAAGGHGFEVVEFVEMLEIKQGPYAGDQDKIRFADIKANNYLMEEANAN